MPEEALAPAPAAPSPSISAPSDGSPSTTFEAPATSRFDVGGDGLSLDQWATFPTAGVPSTPAQESSVEAPAAVAAPGAETGESTPQEPQPGQPAQAPPTGDTVESLIQFFAQQTGLNPQDEREQKVLKRLADKELHIRTLEAEAKTRKAGDTASTAVLPELTEFERLIYGIPNPQQSQQQQPPQPPQGPPGVDPGQPSQAPPFRPQVQQPPPPQGPPPEQANDISALWKTPKDGVVAVQQAWEAGDHEKVLEIENTMWEKRLQAHAGQLLDLVNLVFNSRMAEMPELQQSISEQRRESDREFVLSQLAKVDGTKDIRDLLKADGGQPVIYQGEEFDPTPWNRIVAEHPHLLDIRKDHPDPRIAHNLTQAARLRAAHALWKRNGHAPAHPASVTTETAQQLIETGAELERRKEQDRARQGINAGRGTQLFSNGQSQSYVRSLMTDLPGDPRSLDQIG